MPKFVKRANPLKHLSTYVPERGDEYGGVVGRIEIDKKMQTALYDRFKNGDKSAEELLVKQFLKYVFSIAKNEARKRGIFDQDEIMDAVQEGNEGLLYRLRQKKLDREKGNLMTYFSPWVRQRIAKYYDRERHKIVIPVAKVSLARKYYKYVINFEQRNKKPPTIFQAAKHLKVSEKELEEARQAFSMKSVPSTDEHPLLLENYFGNVFPELNLSWEQKLAKVRKAVEKLPSMLRKTIKLRVGWNENEPRSLEQVGARFGVSKERVRQRELEALKLLAVLLGVDPKKIISIADVSRKKTKKKPKH